MATVKEVFLTSRPFNMELSELLFSSVYVRLGWYRFHMGWKKLGNRFWPRRSQRNQTGSLQVHFLVIRILVLKKQAESAQKANNSQGGEAKSQNPKPGEASRNQSNKKIKQGWKADETQKGNKGQRGAQTDKTQGGRRQLHTGVTHEGRREQETGDTRVWSQRKRQQREEM